MFPVLPLLLCCNPALLEILRGGELHTSCVLARGRRAGVREALRRRPRPHLARRCGGKHGGRAGRGQRGRRRRHRRNSRWREGRGDERSGVCLMRVSKSVQLIRRDNLLLQSVSAGYGGDIYQYGYMYLSQQEGSSTDTGRARCCWVETMCFT